MARFKNMDAKGASDNAAVAETVLNTVHQNTIRYIIFNTFICNTFLISLYLSYKSDQAVTEVELKGYSHEKLQA